MMTRQSMARVSCASPEADLAPAVQTPLYWEAVLGRAAARKSTKSEFSGNPEWDSDDVPSLPFPPGRRPKDGFYLPYSREFEESPDVQLESRGNCPKQRKLFNLKFPGSFKKRSRMRLPFQITSKPSKESHVDEDQEFCNVNPRSGQRFGSSITNRMVMQFQKKQPLWRRCLPSKPEQVNGGSSYIDPNRRRRLDEGLSDGYVTAANSSVSVSSLPSSPGFNSSPVMVNSSRFMASMLISLCPDDASDSQLVAEDGNSDDHNDDIGIPHSTTPRTKSSSPRAFEDQVDPASQTVTSQEKWTCTCRHRASMVESSALQSEKTFRSVYRSLDKELATASRSPSKHSKSEKLVWPRSHGINNSVSKFNENYEGETYPAFLEAPSNSELLRSREVYKSSFSWKPCTENNCQDEEPIEDSVAAQQPNRSEFAETIFDDDEEEDERRSRYQRFFSPGSNRPSSPQFNSLQNTVWFRSNSLGSRVVNKSEPKSKNIVPHSMVGYLSPPRISIEDLNYTSSNDKLKPFARWRSTAEPSALRRSSLVPGGASERNEASVALESLNLSPKQALQRSTTPIKSRVNDLKQMPSFLRPASFKAPHVSGSEESSDDSDYSTDSSSYETSSAVSSHMLSDFASPKPTSPKLPMPNLHCQPRVSPFAEDQETKQPEPSFKQIMMARSHSVRTTFSRRFLPQESQGHTNFSGPSHHPAPASRLAKTSSGSRVMSKVALFESKAGMSKSGPLSTYT